MLKFLLMIALMIFLIAMLGSVILEQFPSLVPLWEEFKMHITNLYDLSIMEYGTGITFLIIISIVILVGSSKKV
ncbi:hypothetical protein EYB33_12250 [Lysinibacillus sphaericus]|uniref:hypothetical protein n=1 Tax=Lysinibacillus TaxID=400634 RepID=UPI00084B4DBE|nr:hypothetical protein [Lysinibacillus sphaericus]OEC01263.1 hypothetical protein GY31_13225 [Lysinibacillus sphaericus]UDK97029.1 hypothetical protein EYB33_12250 [Lysinibacillus sphaericus]